jgi:hypothetical protein
MEKKMKGNKRKMKRLVLVLSSIVLLCFSAIGAYFGINGFKNSNSGISNQDYSNGFEFAIASKCRLLSIVDENLKGYIKAINTINETYNEANPDGKTLSESEIKEIIPMETSEYVKRMLESEHDDLKVHLKGLKNNPCIGSIAKEMLILAEKNQSIIDKAGELYIEMLSDIEIAKSMEINTAQYQSKMDIFTIHWMTFEALKGSKT